MWRNLDVFTLEKIFFTGEVVCLADMLSSSTLLVVLEDSEGWILEDFQIII